MEQNESQEDKNREQARLNQNKEQLYTKEIQGYIRTQWRHHRRNAWIGNCLTAASLVMGGVGSIAGFLGHPQLAGVLGAAVTILIGFQSSFAFRERARFHLIIHNEAKVLRDRLQYAVKTNDQLEEVVYALGRLRSYEGKELPLGKALEGPDTSKAISRRRRK